MHEASIDNGVAPTLTARDIRFAYRPDKPVVNGVSLRVATGEAVAILGPNGSGKSTLMHVLCGRIAPQSGTVRRADGDAATPAGVVFQSPALDPLLTVRENLRDHALLFGVSPRDVRGRIDEVVGEAGLAPQLQALVRTLSGGMRRRLDLARALIHRPTLLLLDEPTTGLDPTARAQFLDMLDEQRAARDLAVVMTTHLMDEAERLDRVLLMHEGVVVADDVPGALRAELGALRVTVTEPRWRPPAGDEAAWSTTTAGLSRPLLAGGDDAGALPATLARAGVAFTVAPPTLADVFEAHTGAALESHDGAAP